MCHLHEDLASYIFEFFHVANVLPSAMLVCQQWYMYGARHLHRTMTFNLAPGLTASSSDVVVSVMKRLVSPTLSTARFIHHLTLSGFASIDVQELILGIISRTTALRSLDMHALHNLPSGMLIPRDIFSSDSFLPNLTAINISSAQFGASLAQTRRMQIVRVHEPMNEALLRRMTSPTGGLAASVRCLELALSIDSSAAAVARMAYLASALATAPLRALALQFVLDRPRSVSWTDFEHAISEMGSSLQCLQRLSSLSLAILPDPIIPAFADGLTGSGDQHREMVTKKLAERVIEDYELTWLRRIELRWHGWEIRDGQLIALPRTQLLRLPRTWALQDPAGILQDPSAEQLCL